jgi:hypothetical protein
MDPPPPDPVEDVFDRLHDDEVRADQSIDPAPTAAELDDQRIRQIATLRRALYRSRSYAIVALAAAAAVAVQLAIMTVTWLLRGHPLGAAAMLVGSIACVLTSIHFYRRAASLHHEATQTHLPAPIEAPDFSTLSDGSQRWKNLEDVR